MKVFCTGISGSGRGDYLKKEAKTLASEVGSDSVKIFSVGDELIRLMKKRGRRFKRENILNVNQAERVAYVGEIFEKISAEIDGLEHAIIDTHCTFFWNRWFESSYAATYIPSLPIDFFVTVIDSPDAIQRRLEKNPQWKGQRLTIDDICLWQNTEVLMTEGLALSKRKPHYVIPKEYSDDTLVKLMLYNAELVYFAFPMTHVQDDDEANELIDRFFERLKKYFAVINPKSIEMSSSLSPIESYHTVKRDELWFVGKSDKVIAYFPKVVHSIGASHEIAYAFSSGKDVWVIFPSEKISPFLEVKAKKVFKYPGEFWSFLEEEYKPLPMYKK